MVALSTLIPTSACLPVVSSTQWFSVSLITPLATEKPVVWTPFVARLPWAVPEPDIESPPPVDAVIAQAPGIKARAIMTTKNSLPSIFILFSLLLLKPFLVNEDVDTINLSLTQQFYFLKQVRVTEHFV